MSKYGLTVMNSPSGTICAGGMCAGGTVVGGHASFFRPRVQLENQKWGCLWGQEYYRRLISVIFIPNLLRCISGKPVCRGTLGASMESSQRGTVLVTVSL